MMSALSIVILSKDVGNLRPCLDAIARHDPGHRIIVVDDGLGFQPEGADYVHGAQPFIFARNANLGISYAFRHDCQAVILLNDDALLATPRGFTKLFEEWKKYPEYGLIASSCNNVGNQNQLPKSSPWTIRNESRMLCFVCVLIPRETWQKAGALDEEFSGYGFEDDAYSVAVKRAGFRLGVFDGCFVDHEKLRSTFRSGQYPAAGFEYNQAIFTSKYGGHDGENY